MKITWLADSLKSVFMHFLTCQVDKLVKIIKTKGIQYQSYPISNYL